MSKAYLLDTSVLSLLAPGRPALHDQLSGWLNRNGHRLYISTITIAEIEQGICKLRRNGGDARAALLSQWLEALIGPVCSGAVRITAIHSPGSAGPQASDLRRAAVCVGCFRTAYTAR